MSEQKEEVKCVVVGDGAVGKTCLLYVYANKKFPTDYVPTIFDNYTASVTVNERSISLALWDTAGQEDYEQLRPLSYPNTDVFIMCFAVTNPTSLENIEAKWVPEVREAEQSPIVLCGTKSDLRTDESTLKELEEEGLKPITEEEGKKMARQIKAVAYLECSAFKNEGVKEVFDEAIKVVLYPQASTGGAKKKSCVLL
mmetsp:Transcript_8789/g.13028  ORF Transcript_8789/g.13028 Transcript_8789/m.13028 type:complete len:198 (-) Transcript_8789:72-665(-)